MKDTANTARRALRLFAPVAVLVAAAALSMTGCPGSGPNQDRLRVVIVGGDRSITQGEEFQFSAFVEGPGTPEQTVRWSIAEEDRHPGTSINPNTGLLRVSFSENLDVLTVTARALVGDGETFSTARVTVIKLIPTVTRVAVTPGTRDIERGGQQLFAAVVHGDNNPSQNVLWTIVETGLGAGTSIGENGLLTVGANETMRTITVRATSVIDPTAYGEATAWPFGAGATPEENFWTINVMTGAPVQMSAQLLAYNDYAEIWVEPGYGFSRAHAWEMADDFAEIRPRLVDAFGRRNFTADGRHFDDIMLYANWLTRGDEGNGKLTVLVLNIRSPNTALTVSGYFFTEDFFDDVAHSNRRDIVYINARLSAEDLHMGMETLVHEAVHLMNFTEVQFAHRELGQPNTRQETWLDEALAENSYYVSFGRNPTERVDWFVADRGMTISGGNNFFVWGNHTAHAIIDDYATAYLFLRWLYLHAQAAVGFNHADFFHRIASSQYRDLRAVTSLASGINPAWSSWETLMMTWLSANMDAANPVFGYIGDDYLSERVTVSAIRSQSVLLFPGEGVFAQIADRPFTPADDSGPNIRYAGLTRGSNGPVVGIPVDAEFLLAFNANLNNGQSSEVANLTGVTPTGAMRAHAMPQNDGPWVVNLWDALRWRAAD